MYIKNQLCRYFCNVSKLLLLKKFGFCISEKGKGPQKSIHQHLNWGTLTFLSEASSKLYLTKKMFKFGRRNTDFVQRQDIYSLQNQPQGFDRGYFTRVGAGSPKVVLRPFLWKSFPGFNGLGISPTKQNGLGQPKLSTPQSCPCHLAKSGMNHIMHTWIEMKPSRVVESCILKGKGRRGRGDQGLWLQGFQWRQA